jgi:hypothetical protein
VSPRQLFSYSNLDYIFASAIRHVAVLYLLISYNIACQWFTNLFNRMETLWPVHLALPPSVTITPAIPKLHKPMHTAANHQMYSLNFIPGVGASDFKCLKRFWAGHNGLGNSTKTQGPGSRQDVLDDHFNFWNWQKYIGMGRSLMRKYKAALAERNIQIEGHEGLSASLNAELVTKWEAMCVTWGADAIPKKVLNPYKSEGSSMFFLLFSRVRK